MLAVRIRLAAIASLVCALVIGGGTKVFAATTGATADATIDDGTP